MEKAEIARRTADYMRRSFDEMRAYGNNIANRVWLRGECGERDGDGGVGDANLKNRSGKSLRTDAPDMTNSEWLEDHLVNIPSSVRASV